MRFTLKKGDRRPALQIRCFYPDGTPFDFSSFTSVVFNMGNPGEARKVSGAVAVFVDRAGGVLEYRWGVNDTDTAKSYRAEFVATDGNGLDWTFPNYGHITVDILDEV